MEYSRKHQVADSSPGRKELQNYMTPSPRHLALPHCKKEQINVNVETHSKRQSGNTGKAQSTNTGKRVLTLIEESR